MNIFFRHTQKSGLLITRFPLESAIGGEEKIHLLLAEYLRKKKRNIFFWGSCSVFQKLFQHKKFLIFPAFFVADITSKKTLLFSPFFFFSLFLQSLFVLPVARIRGAKSILMLSFIEKVFLTPIALLFGFRVFWGHHAPFGAWFFKNPFLCFWKIWARKVSIITPSKALQKQIHSVFASARIIVIANAVFSPKVVVKKSSSSIFSVGTAARISPEKNIGVFLKLAQHFPESNFFIAGDGEQREYFQQKKEEENIANLSFLGFLTEKKMEAFWKSIDVFCLFSRQEPFGIVLLEASARGIPILARPIDGIPEVVLNGETGLLCDKFFSQKKALLQLQNNALLRKKMGDAGRRWAQKFSPDIFIQKMERILFDDDHQKIRS